MYSTSELSVQVLRMKHTKNPEGEKLDSPSGFIEQTILTNYPTS